MDPRAVLARRLADHVVLADGAMGSELLPQLDRDGNLDLAASERPELVLAVHLAFLEAGAELIETATFGASRPRLERTGAGDRVEAVNAAAVKLAREARETAGRDALVGGSIGPLAGVLDFDDGAERARIAAAHAEQASVLAGRGADLLLLETFFRVDELELAIEAVTRETDLPVVCLLTFPSERTPQDYVRDAEVLARLAEADVAAVGVNCAPGPFGALQILREVRGVPHPLAAMPNAGMLLRRGHRLIPPPATPSYLARFAREAVELGCALVGGCCGVGPEHVAAMAAAVAGLTPRTRTGSPVHVASPPLPTQRRAPSSSLAEKLRAGRFVRVVQLDPPKGTNTDRLLSAARSLAAAGAVDAVDINSNPLARLRMDSLWTAVEVQRASGLETVPHVTPRDASLMGLQAQLLGAWRAGVRNLLAITGDASQLGDYPGVHDVYHVDIFELLRAISRLAEGYDCAGNPVGDAPGFLVGVAVTPTAADLPAEIERLRHKVDAGAHYAMSQVFFDWEPWERFLDACGGAPPLPCLVPVWPLTSLRLALRLHHEVPGITVPDRLLGELEAAGPDAARLGWERAARLLEEAPRHAAGAYLIAPFKEPERVLGLLGAASPDVPADE